MCFLCQSDHSLPRPGQDSAAWLSEAAWTLLCCAVLDLILHCSPIFVLSFMFGGEFGYLPEATKEANLELQSSPNVGIYLPFKHLTMNCTSFLRALNLFHYKHQPWVINRSRISAKLNNLQVCVSGECQGQHDFLSKKCKLLPT